MVVWHGRSEEDDQVALVELLVGRALKGEDRQPGAGMTGKYPELGLLYAIPNSRVGRGAGGRMKAMGQLRGMCDLCLPVARGPFHGLYVEQKLPGKKSRPEQIVVQQALREQGYCVFECCGVSEGAQIILGYLALDKNRPSVRPLGRVSGNLDDALAAWRRSTYLILQPKPQ